MRVRVIEPTIAQKRQVMPGEELDLQRAEAFSLISAGRAIALPDLVETTDMPPAETPGGPAVEKPKAPPVKNPAKAVTKNTGVPVVEKPKQVQRKKVTTGSKTKAPEASSSQASGLPQETDKEQGDGLS